MITDVPRSSPTILFHLRLLFLSPTLQAAQAGGRLLIFQRTVPGQHVLQPRPRRAGSSPAGTVRGERVSGAQRIGRRGKTAPTKKRVGWEKMKQAWCSGPRLSAFVRRVRRRRSGLASAVVGSKGRAASGERERVFVNAIWAPERRAEGPAPGDGFLGGGKEEVHCLLEETCGETGRAPTNTRTRKQRFMRADSAEAVRRDVLEIRPTHPPASLQDGDRDLVRGGAHGCLKRRYLEGRKEQVLAPASVHGSNLQVAGARG